MTYLRNEIRCLGFLEHAGWVCLWLILCAVVCWGMPGGRSDDAEIMLHSQFWAEGYRVRNPPLFEWLAMGIMALVGQSMAVVLMLRLACVVFMLALLRRLAMRLGLGSGAALAAALGVTLVPHFYFNALFDLTHTVLAGVFYVAVPLTVLWAQSRPSVRRMLVLGAVVGFGLLTKHIFVLFVVAALVACVRVPSFRILLSPRLLLPALAMTVLVVLPYGLWVLDQGAAAFQQQQQESLRTGVQAGSHFGIVWRQVVLTLGVVLPWLLFWALFLRRQLWAAAEAPLTDRSGVRWIAWTLGVTVLLMAMLWTLSSARRMEGHHLYFMVLAPVLFMAWRGHADTSRMRALAWGAVLWAAVVTPGIYAFDVGRTAQRCQVCGPYIDYAALAQRVRHAGVQDGVLYYASHPRGVSVPALIPHLPGVRVVRLDVPASESPERPPHGACAVIWQPNADTWMQSPPDTLPLVLREALSGAQETARWTVPLATAERSSQEIALLVNPQGCR